MLADLKYLSDNEKEALKELVTTLRARYPELREIKVFGSKIRGDFDKESDIDVFLVFDREVDREFEKGLSESVFEINLKYNVLLSVLAYSTERLKEKRIRALPFIEYVMREGVPI